MSNKDYWVMCANCKDVHQHSEREFKQWGKWKGLTFSHCPKCDFCTMAPAANVPKQRTLFDGVAA